MSITTNQFRTMVLPLATVAVLLFFVSTFALIRPAPPDSIASVTYSEDNQDAYVIISMAPYAGTPDFNEKTLKYHAVLASDLSVSFDEARAGGNYNNGYVVSYETDDNPIKVPVSKSSANRYFVAVSVSGILSDDTLNQRVYSGWKIYRNNDGLPLTIATATLNDEDLYVRAFSLGSQVISYARFSTRAGADCKLTLTHNKTKLLSNLDLYGAVSKIKNDSLLVASNIDTVIRNPMSGTRHVLIRKGPDGTAGVMFYELFSVFQNAGDSIVLTLRNKDQKTIRQPVLAADNPGFSDIVSTNYTLLRIPINTADPINGTPALASFNDSLKFKLVSAATAWLVIAHASPKGNANEMKDSVFTNYIQFMDNIAQQWDTGIMNTDTGVTRIRAIYNEILNINKTTIIDPLFAINRGTAAEFGTQIKLRKNYAFYEGYSRLDCEIDTPTYDFPSTANTAAGVMFRISENVSLYSADLDDTNNMFKEPFITGGPDSRRVIIKATDTLLKKLDKDGVWVKGNEPEEEKKVYDTLYYTGVAAVRLGLKARELPHNDSIPFKIRKEGSVEGDPKGSIVGGPEKSMFKISEIIEENGSEKIIRNTAMPELLLHGSKRLLELNQDRFIGSQLIFFAKGIGDDTNKVQITNGQGYSAIAVDTAVFDRVDVGVKVLKNSISIAVFYFRTNSKRIAFLDAYGGILKVSPNGKSFITASIETRANMRLPITLMEKGKFIFNSSSDKLMIFNSFYCSRDGLLWPDSKNEYSDPRSYLDWDKFSKQLLIKSEICIAFKYTPKTVLNPTFNRHINPTKKSIDIAFHSS